MVYSPIPSIYSKHRISYPLLPILPLLLAITRLQIVSNTHVLQAYLLIKESVTSNQVLCIYSIVSLLFYQIYLHIRSLLPQTKYSVSILLSPYYFTRCISTYGVCYLKPSSLSHHHYFQMYFLIKQYFTSNKVFPVS